MATPLTDSINALTQYANETTGKSDTTLSDAVGSLVEGYGGGLPSGISITDYTAISNTTHTIEHNLGVAPNGIHIIPVEEESWQGNFKLTSLDGNMGNGNVTGTNALVKSQIRKADNAFDYTRNGYGWTADENNVYLTLPNSNVLTVNRHYYLIACIA